MFTLKRLSRGFATKPYEVFSRHTKLVQRERAAQRPQSEEVEYLREEVARKAIERLAFIKRDFDNVLDIGCGSGNLQRQLVAGDDEDTQLVKSKLQNWTMVDSSKTMLHRWDDHEYNQVLKLKKLVVDEETLEHEMLKPESFDAVLSNMSLHWVNDLPATLKKINTLLKKDGLFLASMISEDSLYELRTSLQLAESERRGGISPRVSPLVTVNDMSSLLRQNGFNLVTIDVDEIVVGYPDLFAILEDLQLMGEQNATNTLVSALPRDVLLAAQAIYKEFHGEEGTLPLTYRVLFMIGWKSSESQPKSLERGSGEFSLKDVL
jgi:NADH dehydrogenase [ubiquinone] 1 alpha subcomplex assembly factor 5